ncbi:MAG: DUF547 domain-containing protein, partial [Deltaproteobacteria bacterium]|nr:DUF547 domain-containing protein [Deltaproteobacteria bacterium]
MARRFSESLVLSIALFACAGSVAPPVVAAETPEAAEENGRPVFSHGQLDQVLHKHVDADGLVNYPALKSDRSGLDAYLAQIAHTSPRSNPALFPTRDHALAFWINAYNALALQAVVDA